MMLRQLKSATVVWNERPKWVPQEDVIADILNDFSNAQDGKLSLWRIADDQSNLKRVVAALASNRPGGVSAIGYALLSEAALQEAGFAIAQHDDGGTPDDHANKNWHVHLEQLTARKVADVARKYFDEYECDVISKKVVATLIKGGFDSGELSPARVQKKVKEDLKWTAPRP